MVPPTTPCKGCGHLIVWGVTEEGKRIPLDPRPPVYLVSYNGEEHITTAVRANGEEAPKLESEATFMVSHFATCTHANEFSGKGKKS
jgi:hypothetical protein